MRKAFSRESGAALLEYAIGISLLIFVFFFVGQMLYQGGLHRAGQSQDAVSTEGTGEPPIIPCGGRLSGEECL